MPNVKKSIEVLKDIRSIRNYSAQSISSEIILDIIDCGRMAPTARNIQPWEFVIVTRPNLLKSLSKLIPNGGFLKDVPLAIVVFCTTETEYFLEDGSAATQNILAAARVYGLSSCWIAGYQGSYYEKGDIPLCEGVPCYTPKTLSDEIREVLHVPNHLEMVSVVSIGYSDEKPKVDKRSIEDVLHWNRF